MSANTTDQTQSFTFEEPTTTAPMVPYTPPAPAMPRAGAIYKRMCDAMEDVRAVGKGRENTFHRYKFRGIDDVLTAMHPILARHRLVMLPGELIGEPKVVERDTTKGKAELHVVVRVRWHLVTDDGSYMSFETLGEASDTGDKGCNKAMSASQKYAFIQAFSIPVEDSGLDTENRSPEFASRSRVQEFRDRVRRDDTVPGKAEPVREREPGDDDGPPDEDQLIYSIDALENIHHAKNWRKKHAADVKAQSEDAQARIAARLYERFPDLPRPKAKD